MVCKALGLKPSSGKNGTKWKGTSPLNDQSVVIAIHEHAGGRDIPDGTLRKYLKDLGFKNIQAFNDYRNDL